MKSFLVASTLFIFAVVQAQNSKKECEAIEKLSFVDPMSCCKYPTIKYNESIIATCVKECETGSESGYDKANCCFNFCLDRETGMFVDGELHANKLVDAFTGSSSKDMSDKWREIVTNVVTDCQSLYPKTTTKDAQKCEPSFFSQIMDCTFANIFLSCPNFDKSKDCKRMIQAIDQCVTDKQITFLSYFFNR